MSVRLTVDTAKCQSFQRCVAVAPALFTIAGDGKARALNPADASPEQLLKAARSCPYRAIIAVDEETGQQLFPPPRKTGAPSG